MTEIPDTLISATAKDLPDIHPEMHLADAELAAKFASRPNSPRDIGQVTLLLSRPASAKRLLPERALLSVESGMPEDCWQQLPASEQTGNMQLSIMETSVGTLIANGQELSLFGDNLMFDLDISEQNLPIGSLIQAGAALLQVTPEPHTGCGQYQQRFGRDALRYISQPARREQRLRGVYMKVIEQGFVALGDKVSVVSRA